MCICHVFSILGVFIGELLYAVQKVIQCLAVGSVFTCLVFSLTVMLMLGVGLGYNHCYIEGKKDKSPKPKSNWWHRTVLKESESDETDSGTDTSNDETRSKRSQNTSMSADALNTTTEDYSLSPTMIIPLRSKNDILRLIRRIRKRGQNITLEIISK